MATTALFLTILASLLISGGCVLSQKKLHSDLLAGYNRHVLPAYNASDTVHLEFGLAYIDFAMDPTSDVMQSLVWARLKWTDTYLRWEPSEYDNITVSRFNPTMIWTPDICLYNGWEKTCHLVENEWSYALVHSNGQVLFIPPVRLSHRCDVDRRNWPRDEAICRLKFGSWTYHGNNINLTMYGQNQESAADLSDLLNVREWEVLNLTVERESNHYECCPEEPYHSLTYKLRIRRNESRTAEVAMPIICSAVLMLLSFLIPVQSAQKLTFCWVSVLITVLGLINLFGRMPADAHGTASIASFYVVFAVLLLVFTALEVLVLVLSRPRSAPLPRCLRAFLSGLVGRLLCLDTPLFHDYTPEDNEMLDSSHESGETKQMLKDTGKSYEWALLAGAVDRLCGLVFLLIVAVSVPPNLTWA